jgi:hypothetical protein
LYVPAAGVGLWQGRLRRPGDEHFDVIAAACRDRAPFTIDLLYGDMAGQRTVTRFSLMPAEGDGWIGAVSRHWNVDRPGPRS